MTATTLPPAATMLAAPLKVVAAVVVDEVVAEVEEGEVDAVDAVAERVVELPAGKGTEVVEVVDVAGAATGVEVVEVEVAGIATGVEVVEVEVTGATGVEEGVVVEVTGATGVEEGVVVDEELVVDEVSTGTLDIPEVPPVQG